MERIEALKNLDKISVAKFLGKHFDCDTCVCKTCAGYSDHCLPELYYWLSQQVNSLEEAIQDE